VLERVLNGESLGVVRKTKNDQLPSLQSPLALFEDCFQQSASSVVHKCSEREVTG